MHFRCKHCMVGEEVISYDVTIFAANLLLVIGTILELRLLKQQLMMF